MNVASVEAFDRRAIRSRSSNNLENAARASLESSRGACYADDEWCEAKENLLAFFGVLAEWKAKEIPIVE